MRPVIGERPVTRSSIEEASTPGQRRRSPRFERFRRSTNRSKLQFEPTPSSSDVTRALLPVASVSVEAQTRSTRSKLPVTVALSAVQREPEHRPCSARSTGA